MATLTLIERRYANVCTECDTAIGILASYCQKCGASLPTPTPPHEVDEVELAECEAFHCDNDPHRSCYHFPGETGHDFQRKNGAKFCGVCGTPIN